MTEYTYSIQTDFPNSVVATDSLVVAIQQSAIITALDRIDTSGDTCSIWFKAELSSGDEAILDGLVAAHGGVALSNGVVHTVPEGPRTRDGKQIVTIYPATEGWSSWFTSQGDQPDPPVRGEGTAIDLEWDTNEERGEKFVDLQFIEPVEIHDGEAIYKGDNWSKADKLNFSVRISENIVSPNNTGTGNCNVVQGYVVIPAAGNGAFDIDLSSAIPIPTTAGSGQWDCNHETGQVSAAAIPSKAECLLLLVPVQSYVVRNLRLGSPLGIWDIDTYKVEWLHQTWKLRIAVDKQSAGPGEFSGWLLIYRRNRA